MPIISGTTGASKIKSYFDRKRISCLLRYNYIKTEGKEAGIVDAAIGITRSVVRSGFPAKNTGAAHSHIGIDSQYVVKDPIKYIVGVGIRFGGRYIGQCLVLVIQRIARFFFA